MKKTLALMLAALMVFSLAACGQTQEEEDRYVILTRQTTMSNGTVLEDTFGYDDNWNLSTHTSFQDGQLAYEVTYYYDSHGNEEKSVTDTDGVLETTQTRNSYDDQGRLIRAEAMKDGMVEQIRQYEYHDGDQLKSVTIISAVDGGLLETEQTYDKEGKTLTIRTSFGESPNLTTFIYDDEGRVTEMISESGANKQITNYEYDSQDRLIRESTTDSEGGQGQYSEYTYDGDTQTKVNYLPDGTVFATQTEVRDEAGNVIKSESLDENGQVLISTVCTFAKAE